MCACMSSLLGALTWERASTCTCLQPLQSESESSFSWESEPPKRRHLPSARRWCGQVPVRFAGQRSDGNALWVILVITGVLKRVFFARGYRRPLGVKRSQAPQPVTHDAGLLPEDEKCKTLRGGRGNKRINQVASTVCAEVSLFASSKTHHLHIQVRTRHCFLSCFSLLHLSATFLGFISCFKFKSLDR